MKKPDYYRECLISARCSYWDERRCSYCDERKCDAKFIAILVPAKRVDIPEHWEIWNPIMGLNERLDSSWIVTKWEYIIEEE